MNTVARLQSYAMTDQSKRRRRRKAKVAKVPVATKKYVQKALTANKETNYKLIDNSATNISYDVPLLASWTSVAQEDGSNDIHLRRGDRLQPMKLAIKYQCFHEAVTVISRIILFQWKPDNQVDAPSMAKILEIPGTVNSVYSPYMQDAVDRSKFVVLYDRMHTGDLTGTTNSTHTISVNISKFANKYINYNEDATSGKSQVYVLAFSNVASASARPSFNKIVYFHWKDTA
jgi:hypothetical protein